MKLLSVDLIVLNNFKNDSRVLKEAISLQNNGYDVKVIALHEDPLPESETVQEIPVYRIKLKSRSWSKNKIVQLFKYIEFIYRCIKQYKKTDILHCNDLNTLPIGVMIKKFINKNVKIVYDAHEYEINDKPNQNHYSIKIRYFIEKFLIQYADKVMTVSNGIADEYVRLYGIDKPALVLNTPPFQKIQKKNIFRETLRIKDEQIVFLYQGGLSQGRGIEILLDTFKMLQKTPYIIIFMGYGPLKTLIIEASEKYENIFYHPAVSPDVLLDYTSSADFGILFYENNCLNHYYCSPNKMFEYLMAELPIIVSDLYEMKKIVENENIGIVAAENTSEELKKAIKIIADLDQSILLANIRKLKTVYNWEVQEQHLVKLYQELD